MELKFIPYTLQLKHTFTVSSYSRNTTPSVLLKITHKGVSGYGEASLPQYLGETQESVLDFLKKVDLQNFTEPLDLNSILNYLDNLSEGNNAAKAAVDIALHDLMSKLAGVPLYDYLRLENPSHLFTSFTLGIDSAEKLKQKIEEAEGFKYYKVKLGSENDKQIINTIHSLTDVWLFVDVNQGWEDKFYAIDMIYWLKERNVLLIEQPLPAEKIDDIAWLTEKSPLHVLADEGVKRLSDLEAVKGVYSGVNIKLMKSTGINEALKMIEKAKEFGMKVMIGCMTETSCAVKAAAHISAQADWIDLDGPLLISNDPFEGLPYNDGKIILNDGPGIGVNLKTGLFD